MKAHLYFIPLIFIALWAVYGVWVKDWATRHYKMGFIPGPKNLHAYIWTLRGLVVVALLLIITLYILILTGKLS